MISIIAFFSFHLVIMEMFRDSTSVGEDYVIFLLLISSIAIALYFYRLLDKQWQVLIFMEFAVQIPLFFNGLYNLAFSIFSINANFKYFYESLSAILGGTILLLLIPIAIVNSKQLLNLTTQRWRPEEREKFT